MEKKFLLLIFSLFILFEYANAWIYPEHRDIALKAVEKLSNEDRMTLNRLWSEARAGYESRLTESVIDTVQSTKPIQLDFASWTAIAGDHSTSPQNMLNNVLQTKWILKVADVAAELKINIAKSTRKSQRINAIRDSDIKLQRADLEYATRAGTNNVHFLLARPDVGANAHTYLTTCVTKGTPLNAIGAYSWFHTSALTKASRYSAGSLNIQDNSRLILSALADEAFALHFLEDAYAAGHIAGTWGKAASRKGTHDFYNENGLDVTTWDGRRLVMMGDAYLRPEDADVVSEYIKVSIEQLLSAVNGKILLDYKNDSISMTLNPDTLNVGTNNFMPARNYDTKIISEILSKTPVPGLANGIGELPRFRSEIGMFIGVTGSLNGSTINGGFGMEQTKVGGTGGIEENVRFGLGIEGVLNEAGDGLVFFEVGLKQDATSTNHVTNEGPVQQAGSITSAIPGRSAYNFRLRMPFYLIPGDLIIAAPFLLLISPKTYAKMAITAGNGGLIPWQSGIATPVGRFQFVLGREVGVSIYGTRTPNDVIIIPNADASSLTLLEYESTKFEFPFLEYQPFRTFSTDQSSSIIVQLNTGVDIAHAQNVLLPDGGATPELKAVWSLGMRITFNWRHYFK